jgi:hypothetical protein
MRERTLGRIVRVQDSPDVDFEARVLPRVAAVDRDRHPRSLAVTKRLHHLRGNGQPPHRLGRLDIGSEHHHLPPLGLKVPSTSCTHSSPSCIGRFRSCRICSSARGFLRTIVDSEQSGQSLTAGRPARAYCSQERVRERCTDLLSHGTRVRLSRDALPPPLRDDRKQTGAASLSPR